MKIGNAPLPHHLTSLQAHGHLDIVIANKFSPNGMSSVGICNDADDGSSIAKELDTQN